MNLEIPLFPAFLISNCVAGVVRLPVVSVVFTVWYYRMRLLYVFASCFILFIVCNTIDGREP